MRKVITVILIALSLAASATASSTNTHDADKATIMGCDSDCGTGILYQKTPVVSSYINRVTQNSQGEILGHTIDINILNIPIKYIYINTTPA